jgi:hypothetical protein
VRLLLDDVALIDQASPLSDHHAKHNNGRAVDGYRQADRRSRRLIDIGQKLGFRYFPPDDIPGSIDEVFLPSRTP